MSLGTFDKNIQPLSYDQLADVGNLNWTQKQSYASSKKKRKECGCLVTKI